MSEKEYQSTRIVKFIKESKIENRKTNDSYQAKMPPVRARKQRRGPKAKPIHERSLSQQQLAPIKRPERSYSQVQKIRVLTFLEHHQIPCRYSGEYRKPTIQEASAMYQIPRQTISNWVMNKKEIEKVGRNSQSRMREELGESGRVLWPELESQLYSDFIERREAGRRVRQSWFRIQSKFQFRSLYTDVSSDVFPFSNGWFRGFLSRYKISLRTITKKAQKLPAEYETLIINWLRFNRRNSQPRTEFFWEVSINRPVGRYELANICNFDERPIPYDYLQGKTYNPAGEKTIWVNESQSGWDKRQASQVWCIFADRIPRIPPMIIFRGTGTRLNAEKPHYHPGVLVEFNATAYMNHTLFERYITNHLIPALGGRPSLFALDLMGSHRTPTILDLLRRNNIVPSLIPGGCTSLIQPLDVSVNKPLKELIRDMTDERIFQLKSAADFEKWTVSDRSIMTTHCVGNAFSQFHSTKANLIATSFRKVGLSLPIDGSLAQELDIKGFTHLEIGDWRNDLRPIDDRANVEDEGHEEIEFVSSLDA